MRIGIDARLAAKGRGLGEFAFQLIRHLPANTDHQFIIYSYANVPWDMTQLPAHTIIRHLPASYVISEQLILPSMIRRDRLDLFHATTNTAPLWLPSHLALVLTIHDAMFLTDKQRIPTASSWYQRLGRKYYAFISQRLINRANRLATISQFSRQDIAQGFAIDPQSIRVIYEGVGREFQPSHHLQSTVQKYGLKRSYFLHLGAIDPRKQTAFTITAFQKFLQQYSRRSFQLAITGITASQQKPFQDLINQYQLQDQIRLLGFVSKDELIDLMSGARALLFPSLYEGFGLPMLQAMACRCPVITTDVTALPEIGGSAALYIQPGQTQQLVDQVIKMADDSQLRRDLIQAGLDQVKQFNWQTTAEQYVELYQEAAA